MMLYRFAHSRFGYDLSGEGSRLFGGRWNSKGKAVIYTSSTISLSLLELLTHSISYEETIKNELISIEVSSANYKEISINELKINWQDDEDYTKFIGNGFLKSQSSLLLKVPSAIIPEESNMLINPRHKDFKKIKVKSTRVFKFDVRLFKTAE
jgi:RES domain-containing protein